MSGNTKIYELLENAWSRRREGEYGEARELVEQAEALAKDDDFDALGRIFHVYAQFESDHERPRKAVELYRRSLGFYKQAGNADKIAHSTRHIADIQRRVGNDADSEAGYREAVAIYRANPHSKDGDLANALRGFALILEKCGKTSEAIDAWEETKKLYQALGLREGVDEAQGKLESLRGG